MEPRIIKGTPGGPEGKWDEVQAIQHEPFIFIMSNGSRWLGQEEGDVAELLDMMAKHKLTEYFAPFYTVDPCYGVENPEWRRGSDQPLYIDGPRMYAYDGVVRFSGNFETYSHSFNIDTNHKPTIDALVAAIEKNRTL